MTEFSDPLSLAVGVICAFSEEVGGADGYYTIDIWRLLSGRGWMVSGSQATILLDKYMEAAA